MYASLKAGPKPFNSHIGDCNGVTVSKPKVTLMSLQKWSPIQRAIKKRTSTTDP